MTQPLDPIEDPEIDQLAASSEDEYPRADEQPDEMSIDDALETDRVVAEGPDSRNADGYGFDTERDLGPEAAAATDQGNRDGDHMVDDGDDGQFDEVIDADASLTDDVEL